MKGSHFLYCFLLVLLSVGGSSNASDLEQKLPATTKSGGQQWQKAATFASSDACKGKPDKFARHVPISSVPANLHLFCLNDDFIAAQKPLRCTKDFLILSFTALVKDHFRHLFPSHFFW